MASLCLATPAAAVDDNPTMIENRLLGTESWQLELIARGSGCNGEASRRPIEGYASATSVDVGDTLRIYVSSASDYTIRIFRIGWYGGAGGREVLPPVQRKGLWQAMPLMDPETGLVECRWTDPFVLVVPDTWVSGVHLATLTALDTGQQNYVRFVVRDDARSSDFLAQISVTTSEAYNCWGGKSLYGFNSIDGEPASKVSFDRPDVRRHGAGEIFYYAIQAIRWLEREGFDVTYSTNVDTHARPELLLNHRAFLSIAHDEYWSREMRDHVQALPDSVSVGFFGSNSVYWQIRFEPNQWNEPNRTIVGYRRRALTEDPFALDDDPSNDGLITTRWRDRPVSDPEASLIGVQLDTRLSEPHPSFQDMIVTGSPQWAFEGTGLLPGDRLPGLLGHEVDRRYSTSPENTSTLAISPFYFYGLLRGSSEMTIYGKGQGIVFASGSLQWVWGLDDYEGAFKHPRLAHSGAQALMRNILERMRTLPTVLDVPPSEAEPNALRAWPLPLRGGVVNLALKAPGRGPVNLGIFDISGRRVRTLAVHRSEGALRATWDGRAAGGQPVPPGLWFARARGQAFEHVVKILVVR